MMQQMKSVAFATMLVVFNLSLASMAKGQADQLAADKAKLRSMLENGGKPADERALARKIIAEEAGGAPREQSAPAPAPKPTPTPKAAEPAPTANPAEKPAAPAKKTKSGVWAPGKVTDLTFPKDEKELGRFIYTVVRDGGIGTHKETIEEADKKFTASADLPIFVDALTAKVATTAAFNPPAKPSEPPQGSPGANKPLGSGGLGGVAPATPPPAVEPNSDQPSATTRYLPVWAWVVLAVLVLATLMIVGRRRGWSPRRWWKGRSMTGQIALLIALVAIAVAIGFTTVGHIV